MGLLAKEEAPMRERKLISEDMHHAVCIAVIELGTVYNERYEKNNHEVMFTWELPEERIEMTREDETVSMPMVTSQKYTISLHEKANLRKAMESWLGRKLTFDELQGFDLKSMLNKNCMLQIVHSTNANTGKTYANISTIIPLIKNMEVKTPEHAPVYFTFEDCNELPDVPDWILERIKESQEFDTWKNGMTDSEEDAPF